MSHVTMSIVKCDIFFLPLVLEIETINFDYKRAVHMHVETHFLFTSTLPFLVWLNWLPLEQDVLRDVGHHDIAPAISHFFNCFFGSIQAVGSKVAANNMQSRTHKKVCVTWINSFRISYGFFGFYCFSALSFLWANSWGHMFPQFVVCHCNCTTLKAIKLHLFLQKKV